MVDVRTAGIVVFWGTRADDQGVPSGTIERDAPGFATEVLDALPDATAILDRWGSIVTVNRTWRMVAIVSSLRHGSG